MSNWRTYKKYCFHVIDKMNNQYFNKYQDIEGFDELQKSFTRKSNRIINEKKLKWKKRQHIFKALQKQTVRRAERLINDNNINNDLYDVEALIEPSIFEQLKCIKINEPNDINGFYQFIITKDIPEQQPKYKNNNEPVIDFIFKCESEKQIKHDLKKFLKHIHFPSKVLIRFQGVVETLVEDDNYEYYDLRVKNGRYTTTSIIQSLEDINKCVNNNIHDGINTAINNFVQTNSKSKLCAIYGLELSVYPLGSIGEFIPEISFKFGSMIKKLKIYNCGDNLCFFAAYVYYLIDIGILHLKNPSPLNNQFRSCLKKVFNDFYVSVFPDGSTEDFNNYKGINDNDIIKFCDKYDLKIVVYNFNENVKYNRTYGKGKCIYSVVEEVLKNGSSHFMYCPDINKLSELVFCPKCFIRSYKNNDDGRKKMKQHILKCNGEIKPKLKVMDFEKPYCEVFYNNDLFRYSFIHKFTYTPIKYYITYDFETLSDKIENQKMNAHEVSSSVAHTNQMVITSSAEPFSVAYYTNLNNESGYFCLYDEDLEINNNFIDEFIDYIVKILSPKIKEANKQNFIKCMGSDYNKFKDDIYFNKYLNKYCSNVSVFGWNSANFDTSFIKQHLYKYPEIQFIGSTTSAKQIKISIVDKSVSGNPHTQTNNSYSVSFKDGLLYVSKCSLDEASRTFGKSKERVKGIFPYSLLNNSNIKDNLLRTEPFDKKDFFNTLKQQDLTNEEYEKYISDFKNYKNFYEYTRFYNIKDCEIMIPIMDNLIKMYWKMNIDLCLNISLASCAAQMKYLSCYKDFDINKNYNVKDDLNELEFKLSKYKFEKMCNNYKLQDELAGRNTKNNITVDDYEYFNDLLLKNNLCPLCYRRYTNKNRPTLDRNDNSKSHTKDNVKWMCRYCNCYKSNHDELETKFFIQIRNYAEYMNLPFTINDKNTLNILRSGITGGLSNVQNRDGRQGNNICKLKYNSNNKQVEIIDTKNKITHFSSIDFNSLYPSSYSSQYNELIPYTNHKMYMV